jgi:CheY-like chemotaxis protein
VQILERQAERLHGLLEEMLEVSRLEMGRFVLHQEACELGELAHAALRALHRLGADEGVHVEAQEPLHLTADRERVERAVAAMILRARSHGSPVRVAIKTEASRAHVRVSWEGTPLGPAERSRAFDARWEEPQAQRQGLGMALYVARKSAAMHGGEMACEPNALVLVLPARPSIAQKGGADAGRVLIVDDDEAIARMVAEFLAEHGFTADWAGGGRPALQKLRKTRADLVVLDLRMPDLDGRALLQKLRREGLQPRVVLLSADREVAAAARELRAEGFVEKPFAPETLLAAVRRALAPR